MVADPDLVMRLDLEKRCGKIAREYIAPHLPKSEGFALITFHWGGPDSRGKFSHIAYCSNSDRCDMVKAIRVQCGSFIR